MNKKNINIWGRAFELEVVFQIFSAKPVTDAQRNLANKIEKLDFMDSLDATKNYIMKYDSNELNGDPIENIFRYVMPKRILITQSTSDIFAIMCNYKFDMEHGIAVVYEDGKFKEVGPQDIIL